MCWVPCCIQYNQEICVVPGVLFQVTSNVQLFESMSKMGNTSRIKV
jgi:hypothetical protein